MVVIQVCALGQLLQDKLPDLALLLRLVLTQAVPDPEALHQVENLVILPLDLVLVALEHQLLDLVAHHLGVVQEGQIHLEVLAGDN